jgi:Cu+-exporting ATPase
MSLQPTREFSIKLPPILPESQLFFFATPVQFIGGWRFYKGTLDAIRARQANMDSLIAIGTSAAWAYNTFYTFFSQYISIGWGFQRTLCLFH